MATVLEEYTTEEKCSIVCFYWQKESQQRVFTKICFSVYGGKCLTRKAVHNWVERFSHGRSKVTDDARPGAGDNSQTLPCCGFRRTGKAMGQLRQFWWRIFSEITVFFSCSNITYFTFYINLWPIYWPSLVLSSHLELSFWCDLSSSDFPTIFLHTILTIPMI
jgi:hypothetical protein